MNEKNKLNNHGDHIATCLCCKAYYYSYSTDMACERGVHLDFFIGCTKKHFDCIDIENQHNVLHKGETCADFEPRKIDLPMQWMVDMGDNAVPPVILATEIEELIKDCLE